MPDENYTQDSEDLLLAVEFCVASNMTTYLATKQFGTMIRFIEATMCCPLKPMMLFRNMNSPKDMMQVLIALAESSQHIDNQFE